MTDATTERPFGQPRDQLGGNLPPLAEQLALEHEGLLHDTETLAERANLAPKEITTDEELALAASLGKQAGDLRRLLEGTRVTAVRPYLDGQKTVNGFFGAPIDRLKRILDTLEQRAGKYQSKKAAEARAKQEEERRRLEAEAAERRRAEAEEAERIRQEEARKREVAEAEAERGRAKAAANKTRDADELAAAAAAQQKEAEAQTRQDEAKIAAVTSQGNRDAKEAAKVRSDDGTLASTTTRWAVEIADYDALNLNDLKPYFSRGDVEKAARGFIKAHRDSKPVAGLRIFPDTKATFR